jgi:hypothetical protein
LDDVRIWKEASTVLVRRLLFETRLGEWLLATLERRLGLCVVQADWLGTLPACSAVVQGAEVTQTEGREAPCTIPSSGIARPAGACG